MQRNLVLGHPTCFGLTILHSEAKPLCSFNCSECSRVKVSKGSITLAIGEDGNVGYISQVKLISSFSIVLGYTVNFSGSNTLGP